MEVTNEKKIRWKEHEKTKGYFIAVSIARSWAVKIKDYLGRCLEH